MYTQIFFADNGDDDEGGGNGDSNGDGDDFAKTQAFRSKLQYTRRAYTDTHSTHGWLPLLLVNSFFSSLSMDVVAMACAADNKRANERAKRTEGNVCV